MTVHDSLTPQFWLSNCLLSSLRVGATRKLRHSDRKLLFLWCSYTIYWLSDFQRHHTVQLSATPPNYLLCILHRAANGYIEGWSQRAESCFWGCLESITSTRMHRATKSAPPTLMTPSRPSWTCGLHSTHSLIRHTEKYCPMLVYSKRVSLGCVLCSSCSLRDCWFTDLNWSSLIPQISSLCSWRWLQQIFLDKSHSRSLPDSTSRTTILKQKYTSDSNRKQCLPLWFRFLSYWWCFTYCFNHRRVWRCCFQLSGSQETLFQEAEAVLCICFPVLLLLKKETLQSTKILHFSQLNH